jgi:hypothetical protein
MKVALCFSGNIRDIEETKNFWTDLIKQYDMDVYASVWDTENVELGDTINNFQKIYNFKKLEVESYENFKKSTQSIASSYVQVPQHLDKKFQDSTKAFAQISMWYKIWKANLLSKELGVEYDVVIRARTDTFFDENLKIEMNNCLNIPVGVGMVESLYDSEGINDCFGFGPPKIMDYYSFLFLQVMEYLSKGHYAFPPEHFLYVHMSKLHVKLRFFSSYMTITRVSRGTPNEIYNGYIKNPYDSSFYADEKNFIPTPEHTFRKDKSDLNFEQ